MANARELFMNIRTGMRSLEEKILHHRYLAALETGRLPREKLRTFASQQYQIITSDLRSIALLISRYGNLPSRPYLLGVLEGENAAFDALWKFARALGMSDTEISTAEPIPAALAYSAFLAWLALYGSDAELAAALGVNFAAWGANCGRMSAALKAHYGLEPGAVAFFDLFANLPPADDTALAVIQGGLDRGITTSQIARAARLLQGYELMYWDSMIEDAGL
jgi:pyrroloquinoline quinone (PQQ) biosynthesis protein C